MWRAREYTTSSAVSELPSWKVMPLRRVKVQTLAPSLRVASASDGCGARLASRSNRPS